MRGRSGARGAVLPSSDDDDDDEGDFDDLSGDEVDEERGARRNGADDQGRLGNSNTVSFLRATSSLFVLSRHSRRREGKSTSCEDGRVNLRCPTTLLLPPPPPSAMASLMMLLLRTLPGARGGGGATRAQAPRRPMPATPSRSSSRLPARARMQQAQCRTRRSSASRPRASSPSSCSGLHLPQPQRHNELSGGRTGSIPSAHGRRVEALQGTALEAPKRRVVRHRRRRRSRAPASHAVARETALYAGRHRVVCARHVHQLGCPVSPHHFAP